MTRSPTLIEPMMLQSLLVLTRPPAVQPMVVSVALAAGVGAGGVADGPVPLEEHHHALVVDSSCVATIGHAGPEVIRISCCWSG